MSRGTPSGPPVDPPREVGRATRTSRRRAAVPTADPGGLDASARLAAVTAALGADAWEWDPATETGRWQPSHYDLFAIRADEDFPSAWRSRVHPDDIDLVEAARRRAFEQGWAKIEYRYRHPERGERWIVTRAARVEQPAGPRVVAVSLDVTEEKRATLRAISGEAHLRLVLDTLSAFVGVTTPDGILLEANRAPLEVAGLRREDVIGRPFEETYWWSYEPKVQAQLRAAIDLAATGVPSRYDVPVRVADGRFITIDFQIAPVVDAGGVVTHLVPSAVDVTERVRIASALQASEGRLQRALEAAHAGTFEIDLRTGHVSVTPATNELFGLPREFEGLMSEYLARIHGEDRGAVVARINESIATASRHEVEYRIALTDGGIRWLSSRAEPVVDESGSVVGMVGTLLDVTRRRAGEEILRESEERFRSTFEHAAVGLVHVSLDGRYLRVNGRFAQITGYTSDELAARTFLEITHPDDLETDLAFTRRLLEGEQTTQSIEKRYLRPDGSIVWVEVTGSLVRHADGSPAYFIGAVQDVTGRRVADDTIRRQLAEIEAIYQSAPVGLGVLDADLRFQRINDRLAEINGLPAAKHIGRTMREVLPGLADAAEPALREVLRTGRPAIGIEISGETAAQPGAQRSWVESWMPVLDASGGVVGISIVAEEVTERLRAERLRDKFVSMLSHELRTPVTTLYAASELLRRRATGLQADLVDEVATGAVRLHRMVENLLVLARVERGTSLLGHEPVLLHRVLPRVIETERRFLDDHRIELVLPGDLPPVRSEPDALAQVLTNLLSNAAKYGTPGGTIGIVVEADADEVRVHVRDDGPGFEGADPSRLFEMYYRAQAASLRAPGAGIGLFVCRALVEAMGGRIQARERPEGGAEFCFGLPVFRDPD